uniref:Uncharacterized protein n=1 Tax=Setaria viridis TaxID=4556 RepID=A0A4U6UIC2_SETVI|nr:hypothetical protein SEVIR_5G107600v2 [Setaria viridis]
MDGWRQMAAATVPAILAHVGTSTDAPETITVARRKLGTQISLVRALRGGSLLGQIDFHEIDVSPVGVCPTVFIRSTLRIVAHDAARHAVASHVLALYVRAHPNLEGTPMWQAWKDDHTRVNMHAGEAVRLLRLALALAKRSTEAVHVAGSSFPHQSAGWTAWMLAAERNAGFAREAAAGAREELRRMGEAAMAEYGKARILIDTVDG